MIPRPGKIESLVLIGALLMVVFHPLSAEIPQSLEEYDNGELLHRADRAFSSRNFLAAKSYFGELNRRLTQNLSSLSPSDTPNEVEIPEELILAPFGLGHSLLYLHRYDEARKTLENGLKIYPDWATDHLPVDFFSDPDFTGPVLLDLQKRIRADNDPLACQLYGYIRFFRGDLEEAKVSFSIVTSLDHDNFFANYFLDNIRRMHTNGQPSLRVGTHSAG
jgi:tetratricopeptide (TPR) repeat protein